MASPMKRATRALGICVLASSAAMTSACVVPLEAPGMRAQIVDAVTGQGIAGARVTLWPDGNERLAAVKVTDAEGRFAAEAIPFRVIIPPLPMDFFPQRSVVRIEALGYATREFGIQNVMPNRPGDQAPSLRRIELQRSAG